MYTKILIPLDGSTASERVLPFAHAIAATLRIPIELLEIVDSSAVAQKVPANNPRQLDALMAEGEWIGREHLNEIAKELANVKVTCTVERGKVADVIIERAGEDKGTLIAMVTHGRSGISRWMSGSVAETVLRGSTNPLFLVRADETSLGDSEAVIKSIIVPLDGSMLGESVLPTVVEIAKTLDAEVVLCRAYELSTGEADGCADERVEDDEKLRRLKGEVQRYLAAKTKALKEAGLKKVTWVARRGSGAEEIIRYARAHRDALVAMCTHGRTGVRRRVLGSVTEKVLRHSDDPVLIVHAA
ncbi:MAG TPA: universal stress protein [Acidobacteriota bacterium]|nr:universal stress protein [Acidobacteriota bacterium]